MDEYTKDGTVYGLQAIQQVNARRIVWNEFSEATHGRMGLILLGGGTV
jgi:hypothetical protein